MTLEDVPICFTRADGIDEDGRRLVLFGKPHALTTGHLDPPGSPFEPLVGNRVNADQAVFFACLTNALNDHWEDRWHLEDELAKIRRRKAA